MGQAFLRIRLYFHFPFVFPPVFYTHIISVIQSRSGVSEPFLVQTQWVFALLMEGQVVQNLRDNNIVGFTKLFII